MATIQTASDLHIRDFLSRKMAILQTVSDLHNPDFLSRRFVLVRGKWWIFSERRIVWVCDSYGEPLNIPHITNDDTIDFDCNSNLISFEDCVFDREMGMCRQRIREDFITCNISYPFPNSVSIRGRQIVHALMSAAFPLDTAQNAFLRMCGECLGGGQKSRLTTECHLLQGEDKSARVALIRLVEKMLTSSFFKHLHPSIIFDIPGVLPVSQRTLLSVQQSIQGCGFVGMIRSPEQPPQVSWERLEFLHRVILIDNDIDVDTRPVHVHTVQYVPREIIHQVENNIQECRDALLHLLL